MTERTMSRPIRAMLLAAVALTAVVMFGVEAASASIFGSPAPPRRAAMESAINAQPVVDGEEFEETATKMPVVRKIIAPPRAPRVSLTAQQQTIKKVTVHRR